MSRRINCDARLEIGLVLFQPDRKLRLNMQDAKYCETAKHTRMGRAMSAMMAQQSRNLILLATVSLASLSSSLAVADPILSASPSKLEPPITDNSMMASTSGRFETTWGSRDLIGFTSKDLSGLSASDSLSLGSIAVGDRQADKWTGTFKIEIHFANGLPSVELAGEVGWLGYNPAEAVINPSIKTIASDEQIGLYPELIQRLIESPTSMRSMSFAADPGRPLMEFAVISTPISPGDPVLTPEPASWAMFALALSGLYFRVKAKQKSPRLCV